MNRIKSIFIGLYPMLLAFLIGLSAWRMATTGAWLAWLGPLLTAAPFAAFLTRVMLLRDVARTSGTFPGFFGLALVGVAASAVALALGQPGASSALALAGLGAATFALYSLWYSRLGRQPSRALEKGKALPELELIGADGKPFSTRRLSGAPALLFFFRGNWCPLCMAQIKEIAARYRELAELGVKVAMISPQPQGHTAELAKRFEVPFLFLSDPQNRAARQLGLEMKNGLPMGMGLFGYDDDTVLPTVIVLDEKGLVRWADETDNYRVRPEPDTFLPLLRELARQPGRAAA